MTLKILRTFENTVPKLISKDIEYNNAIVTFCGLVARGNMDISIDTDKKVVYETLPRKKFLEIIEKNMNTFAKNCIVVRTFHKNHDKNSEFPSKKIYAYTVIDGKMIKLSREINMQAQCTGPTGEILEPESDVEYM